MPIICDVAPIVDGLRLYQASRAVRGGEAVHHGTELIARNTEQLLKQRSHALGTPTPSAPGQPPAKIHGDLAGSITPGGLELTATSAHEDVGPSGVEYARVQELGGPVHNHTLPARPYLRPGLEHSRKDLYALFVAAWSRG